MISDMDVIATRTLELRHEDGSSSPVLVRIARPRPHSDDYRCDYEIEGLSNKRSFSVFGVDAVQALWLAMVGVGVDLQTSKEGKAGRLALYGEPELGFPPAEQVTRPEWHPFVVDGEDLHWRRYPSWQQTADETFVRSWTLEVARRPDAQLGVGTYYPKSAEVGVEQALALVRLCKEQKTPFP
jgi:hypothetical protein